MKKSIQNSIKTPVIELKNIEKSFGNKKILEDLNLKIYEGESFTVIGPGASGKSLLLKILSLIHDPNSGSISFYGKNLMEFSGKERVNLRQNMGVLFQNHALFDSLTVEENIGFYLFYHTKISRKQISKRVQEYLHLVQLDGIETLRPSELSGGMKKRVGIARALIHNPKLVVLDEPTAGLDPITTDAISRLIRELHSKISATFISATNDLNCAKNIADRLGMLYQGKIYRSGEKDKILNDPDPLLQQFLQGKRQGPIDYHEKLP